MRQYKNLKIWERSVDLALLVYKITSDFPKSEIYGLTSQLRRCSVSISSNIAEGAARSSDKEFQRFLDIAYGSCYELQSQLFIAFKLNLLNKSQFKEMNTEMDEIQKMIFTFSKTLNRSLKTHNS